MTFVEIPAKRSQFCMCDFQAHGRALKVTSNRGGRVELHRLSPPPLQTHGSSMYLFWERLTVRVNVRKTIYLQKTCEIYCSRPPGGAGWQHSHPDQPSFLSVHRLLAQKFKVSSSLSSGQTGPSTLSAFSFFPSVESGLISALSSLIFIYRLFCPTCPRNPQITNSVCKISATVEKPLWRIHWWHSKS